MASNIQKPSKEPCVIVGAACRVPGATNTHALWEMLEKRKDVQQKMPADRYNADAFYHTKGSNKGTSNARLGYYLDQGLDQFDASFFNISGKEAEAMDPQQRLLLEVVYEALENAGITLDDVRGSRTSVYAGSFTYDYQSITHRELNHYPKYSITGSSTNTILANRISFFFGLHGPSIQVDTACSSSLTGLHLGAQSLQSGESDIAIICGTALHFDPTIFITMTDFGMLSTDGRCRHFDANASGYVRGDGICAIILKKQHLAELHGNNIRAIVRGTGANHDGTKEGLTLPNPKAQADLVREVYAAAGLEPKDTGYFEAHGTGTQAGDPREALGIGSVFAADRTDPLYVGSIKTNIGHLEGASGLAGLIKSMLSVEKGKILPNMHFNTPNPDIDFEGLKIRVPQEVIDWNPTNGIRRASVNSFGFGGSNAHVVLENYRKPQAQFTPPDSPNLLPLRSRPFLLPLTSHSENGGKFLQKTITTYIDENPHIAARDLVHSYSTRRTLHQFRTYAIGSNLKEIWNKASNLEPEAKWKRASTSPRIGFVFTGQGAQWHAMGRQLIEENALFRHVLAECEATLQTLPDAPGWSLLDELRKPESDSRVSQSEFSQPLCTALQIALVDVLKTWAIEPSAVVGHSSGEIAAAYAAGILSRRDAIICAFYRGLYMSKGKDGAAGSMMAVGLTEVEAALELESYAGSAGIAAINSPSSITLSGNREVILEIKEKLDAKKVFARLLQVEQAFHSHHMIPLAPPFERALASTGTFSPNTAKIRMFSSVTARDSSARTMDSTYWSDNMTGRVRFSDALTGMVLDDNDEPAIDILVEIGPHPGLKGPSKQTIKALGLDIPYVASLDRKLKAYDSLLSCAGQLFAFGYKVDLEAVNSDYTLSANGNPLCEVSGKMLNNIPTYSWDHKSYWAETRYSKEYRQRACRHSILGSSVPGSPSTNPRWHNYLRNSELTWMSAHSIDNVIILPGAAYFTIAIEALIQTVPAQQIEDIVLSDVSIKAALSIPDSDMGVEIMTDLSLVEEISNSQNKSYKFAIYSFAEDGETVQNCSGTISATTIRAEQLSECTFEEFQTRTLHRRPASKFYEHLSQIGLKYGEAFRLVSGAFESASGFAVAALEYNPSKTLTDDSDACVLHPTLVDSAFHVIFAALESKLGQALDDAYVPTFCRTLRISASIIARKHDITARRYWVTAETDVVSPRLALGNVVIHESDSKARLVELHGLQFTALGLSQDKELSRPVFFRIKWKAAFDFLGLNSVEPEFSDLEDLLACYTHQYPENKILHISSTSQTIEEASQFDLVVVDLESHSGVHDFLKPNGFLVSTKPQFTPEALQQKFTHGDLSIWQAPSQHTWPKSLTLLLASSPSDETLNIVRTIQREAFSDKISITTLIDLDESSLLQDDFVSLVGLDENIFADASSQSLPEFDVLKRILCTPAKNLVWVYKTTDVGAEAISQSLISGLARVARIENDSLRLVTLELQEECISQHVCDWIHHTFALPSQDDELAVKGGRILIPRVERDEKLNRQVSGSSDAQTDLFLSFKGHRLRLMNSPFSINPSAVAFEHNNTIGAVPLADDEVELAVKASSLTREDTLASCVGTIIDTGCNSKLRKGDLVFALSPNETAHASILRTKSHFVHTVATTDPAASLGVPLLKARYALLELARIQKGDICLVHDALSITGQIAISIIQAAGAEVIATVRKNDDREYLRDRFGLSVDSVLVLKDEDSTELVRKASVGRECRVFLNCSTTSTEQDFSDCVGIAGLLIEFGKRKIRVARGDRNITHASVDLAAVINEDIHLAQRLLQQSFKSLEDCTVKSPPDDIRFPYSRMSEAFHSFKTDPSLNQVLLYAEEDLVPVRRSTGGLPTLFNSEKTYLIVGGLGGIGQILAQWMFRKGARKLSFLARSGATKADAKETIEWLEKRGAVATVYHGSVADELAVRQWVGGIEGDLGGVLQCATVLRSGSLSNTTALKWQTVLDPKVNGTLNLHHATIGRPLDFFLCFSSLLAIIGFPSEANYSAANGFMDHFIAWRRKQGLPGASINIGVVADAGLIAENESLKTGMQRMHMDMLSENELFFQIEQGILSQYPAEESDGIADHQLLSGINVASRDPHWSSKPLFRRLYANVSADGTGVSLGVDKDLLSLLCAADSPENTREILTGAFIEKISSSLSISSADIHLGLPLSSYGMDSLVAVDFRKWFSKEIGVDLALFDILGSKTTGHLIHKVCAMFATQQLAKPDFLPSSKEKVEKQVHSQDVSELVISNIKPDHLPLSSFQTRLWFMDNIMEKAGGLNIGVTLMIKGKPQFDRINRSFHELARRNETLRTRYFEGDEFAEQEVLPMLSTNVQYLDISTAPAPFDHVQSQVEELTREPMDLEKGEVYRSRLVQLGDAQYAWLFSIHHIAVDGGSRESFMEQIVSCYNDVGTEEDSSISAPKLSYINFTLWHEGILKSAEVQSDLAWWKEHLSGARPTSKLLPFAQNTRPAKSSDDRRTIRSRITKTTLKRMKRICSTVNVTPFHFVLAALRAFVFRYTTEEDLTVLVINGERPHPSFEGILGLFVNVIPLRWKGAFDDSFESLLLEAKSLAMESMAHSQAPFNSIVDSLNLGWSPQNFPLGQIALNYHIYAKSPKYATTDFEILDVHITDVPTACELQFEVLEDPETGLGFALDYDSYLYGGSEMDRFLENFMTFVGSAVRDFRQPIEELDMCGELEFEFLQTTCWLEEASTLQWMDMPLWERFTQVAHQQPRSIAVMSSDGNSITYESLKRRAEGTATLLQSHGICQGDRVGVLSHPSIDAIAAMLSTSILRCTYVPLDPNYAPARLEYMIEDTDPSLILYGPGLHSSVESMRKSTKSQILPLSTSPPATALKLHHEPGKPEDLFYIVYTSGSTGKPKGIMVSHENTRAMLAGRNQALDLSSTDCFLSHSSISFDISITQTWGSFVSGATVALATNDTKQDIKELATFIRDASVTMIFMTPTQFAMMIENCPKELRGSQSLRAVSMIGEHLHPRLATAIHNLGIPHLTVFNEYGPSETTSQNTLYKVPYPSSDQRTIDVGRPLPNNSVYIVNSKLNPVPVGVTGELCLGGPQISLGYLGNSNPVFMMNPFVSGIFKSRGWDRLYRTGDLARFRKNGLIDLEGRKSGDKQIKLRGNRIDLEEIESEIHRVSSGDSSLPFKQGVVVIARILEQTDFDSLTDDRQLVAFIITEARYSRAEYQTMANTLHVELRKTLNGYMLPAYYQMMDTIPTTLSGKVNRVELSKMKLDPIFHLETAGTEGPEGPGDQATINMPKQDALLGIIKNTFATVLKLPGNKRVQDMDNFFNLGGHSILALRLQKALTKELGTLVKLIEIFRNPTPTGLATVLMPKLNGSLTSSNVPSVSISKELDWSKETHLPDDKRYWPGIVTKSNHSGIRLVKGTLLIGADGFVGYYMLKYLLTLHPDTKVYLLSLGGQFNLGDLFARFMQYNLFDKDLSQADLLSRTEIIQGTMEQDKYGLSDEAFDKLGQNVQSIYHTGGFVSLLANYSDLRARNVQSIFTMIELASRGRDSMPTSLHYISTWSVIHLQTWKTTSLARGSVWLDEQNAESFQPSPINDHGYFKTRWVAEMLMEGAARRGFPTTIYRCPAHTAPIGSLSATPSDNFTINMYLSMVESGLILRMPERTDKIKSDVGMVPIDYLTDTIVRLADTKESRSATGEALRLHIINPNPLPYSKAPSVIAQVRDDHVFGRLLDLNEWFEAITASSNEKEYLGWTTYKEYLDNGHLMFTIHDPKTRLLLKGIDSVGDSRRVKCPPVDAEYFGSILKQKKMFTKGE